MSSSDSDATPSPPPLLTPSFTVGTLFSSSVCSGGIPQVSTTSRYACRSSGDITVVSPPLSSSSSTVGTFFSSGENAVRSSSSDDFPASSTTLRYDCSSSGDISDSSGDSTLVSQPPSSSSSTVGTLLSSGESGDSTSSSGDFSLISGDIPPAIQERGHISTAAREKCVSSGASTSYSSEIPTVRRKKCVGRHERLSWGWTSVIGQRGEMEDAVAIVPGFVSRTCGDTGGCTATGCRMSGDVAPLHFFGVYDGHGGSQVASFCAKKMHGVIAEELNQERIDEHEWQKKWEKAFCSGFRRADNEVMTDALASKMVGSTAVVAVVSGCQIILSNCGDSRAVLCKGTQTIPLTVDHKPDRVDELSRIEGLGGKVINWLGARVSGVLAMSRAIGDRHLSPFIIPVPEVTFMTRSEEDECLILASDGLWDVMSNDKVGNVARDLFRQISKSKVAGDKSPAQVVADNLTQLAIRLNSSDNISIIVVDLKPRRRLKQSTEMLGNPN